LRLLNIIHLEHRSDRLLTLYDELHIQQIPYRKIWNGILDKEMPARGILKAHQQVISYAKREGLNKITIAEDDIHFTAKGAYRYYLANEPHDYDLYLGGITWGNIEPDGKVNDFSGTSLYTITERFYDTFLELQPGMDFDRQLAGRGIFQVCYPLVAFQHNGYSDNSHRFMDFTRYINQYEQYKN
jgi:hypothetical protein